MFRALLFLSACVLSSNQPHIVEAASPELKGIACRSVHLSYHKVPDAAVFYNEVRVEKSADGTYFCVCGFSRGYYGIQELADGKKVILFSVWDPGDQNDPNSVKDEQRVKLLHNHPEVRVKRFGNEGTGGQSFLDFDWQIGQTYRLAVAARRAGNRTQYASFFFHPSDNAWRHLVTFSTLTEDMQLSGYYAFIEDFRRNRLSTKKTRKAQFSNPWVMRPDQKWQAVEAARFTGDGNPVMNIDSGVESNQFWIATGGDLTNQNNKLNEVMHRQSDLITETQPDDLTPVVSQWLKSED
jgi:hypothetical protein